MKSNFYRHEIGRAVENKTDGRIGTITPGGEQNLEIFIKGEDWSTDFLSEDQFELDWSVLDYCFNKRGQKIELDSYWFMSSPACKYFNDESFVGKIVGFGGNGTFRMEIVNWKRKGSSTNYNFFPNDFDIDNKKDTGFRLATQEEIKYFNKRRGIK